MMLAPHSARRVASPSQQRLRRSSVAAASAPGDAQNERDGAGQRDAQNERDGAGLRSSVAAATPSRQRLRRSSVAAALQPISTQLVASLLEMLLAAPRGETRRHLEGGRALRAACCAQHQLRRCSISSVAAAACINSRRRQQCPATSIAGQPLDRVAPKKEFRRTDKVSFIRINLPKELSSLF